MLFLAVTALVRASAGEAKTDREQLDLIGPVHIVVSRSGAEKPNGSSVLEETREYDRAGNLIESKTVFYWNHSKIRDTEQRSVHHYSPTKGEKEATTYGGDGTIRGRSLYKYDSSGNTIESANYDANGVLTFRSTFSYDDQTRLIEGKTYKGDGSLLSYSRSDYRLDAKGRVIADYDFRMPVKPDHSSDYKTTAILDNRGKPLEETFRDGNGSFDKRVVNKYNSSGMVAETAVYNANGSLREKELNSYKFDVSGNWIKKITKKWVIQNGQSSLESTNLIDRTITYYQDLLQGTKPR